MKIVKKILIGIVLLASPLAQAKDSMALEQIAKIKDILQYLASPDHDAGGAPLDLFYALKPRSICYRIGRASGETTSMIRLMEYLKNQSESGGAQARPFNEQALLDAFKLFSSHLKGGDAKNAEGQPIVVGGLEHFCNTHPDIKDYPAMDKDFEMIRRILHRDLVKVYKELDSITDAANAAMP